MAKDVWLKCQVVNEVDDDNWITKFNLFDGTPAEMTVRPTLIVKGVGNVSWVKVQPVGENFKDNKVAVQLPSPSINFGKNVAVSSSDIKKDDVATQEEVRKTVRAANEANKET